MSHICMVPFAWPVKRYLRGREPMREELSHSCKQKQEMAEPSTDLMSAILNQEMLQ